MLKIEKQEMDAKKPLNQNGKKQKNDDPTAELNSDEEESSSYYNVFNATKVNSEQTTTITNTSKTASNPTKQKVNNMSSVNKLKMTIKKQPIIKAGQTQKDRDEINSLFIGKIEHLIETLFKNLSSFHKIYYFFFLFSSFLLQVQDYQTVMKVQRNQSNLLH